jgi:hypothetical protein
MTPAPRRNLALFTFGAAAILSGCSREDKAATSGTTAPSPYQTGAAAPAPGAPVEPSS